MNDLFESPFKPMRAEDLTLDKVLACVHGNDFGAEAMRGIVNAQYKLSIQRGKAPHEAAKDALDRLADALTTKKP